MTSFLTRAICRATAMICVFAAPAFADEPKLNETQQLGKRIFEDALLSEPRGMACISCHDARHAFQGGNSSQIPGVAVGSRADHIGVRKVPTLMYKSYSPPFGFYKDEDDGKEVLEAKGGQFWDGRAADLAEQMKGPLVNPDEMNNASLDAVVAKIEAGDYADLARKVYGEKLFEDRGAAMDKLAQAMAAYEQSEVFAPFSSKFDDWLRGKAKLSPLEAQGYRVFIDPKRGNCTACHAGKPESKDPADWLFTDFTYDAFGMPRNPALPANADPNSFDLGLCARPGLDALLPKEITKESLCGAFKVPTLRNVAVNASFYHNAAFRSLKEAVAIYATRDTDPAHWYKQTKFDDMPEMYRANVNIKEVPYDRKLGQKPRLDYGDIEALTAFLKTLTDKGME